MSWGAVITAAGAVVGGVMNNRASRNAANAAGAGGDAAIDELRAAREQNQQNIQPYLDFGQVGINRLQGLLNDPNSIQNSNAYQFRFNQGLRAQDRSAAARGGLFGGGHQADLINFGQGMASQEYDNQWNRLMGVAGLGQNSAVGANALNQQAAGQIGQYHTGIGNARASSYQQQGQNNSQMLGAVAGGFNNWLQGRNNTNNGWAQSNGIGAPIQVGGGFF